MKYGVHISYSENAYVEVHAANRDEAVEKAQVALDNGEVEVTNALDEPDYEFEVEEL